MPWRRMGNGGIAPRFSTTAIDGGEWSASGPCRFTPKRRAPGPHCIGGWVCPRAGLDAVEQRKMSCLAGNRTPAVQLVAHHYTDWAIPAPWNNNGYTLVIITYKHENRTKFMVHYIISISSYRKVNEKCLMGAKCNNVDLNGQTAFSWLLEETKNSWPWATQWTTIMRLQRPVTENKPANVRACKTDAMRVFHNVNKNESKIDLDLLAGYYNSHIIRPT
jgi:hypothetical protein